ncbi:MAG: penicillin-insensitive murein endopeptidase [Pararhizobium sp.]|nr:penicillin-insensitive murein endopeptidase [Pararhizobium sp.]MDO9417873.1 penicillin-insensitive murein endopeptidase [Pararhizobium sp.]
MRLRFFSRALALALAAVVGFPAMAAEQAQPAREIFGGVKLPAKMNPAAVGFYAKGCLAGAVAIPSDGPTWQAMRLSRNRRWGHPNMIALIERLSADAAAKDGWPGLLLGDISQPRGGPMKNGHSSHQVGLDADIWLTPMPRKTLTRNDRENQPFISMLQKNKFLTVDPKIWTPAHARLIMRAASYPQVERIFVNPAIKKKLCQTWTGDRSDLGKVRPYYGHDSHFHIRIKCPDGSSNCKAQAPVAAGDGCDGSLDYWFTQKPWAKPKDTGKPVKQPRLATLADLPNACRAVLAGRSPASEADVTYGETAATALVPETETPASVEAVIGMDQGSDLPANVPIPLSRPVH